jgi:5-methylcytosine-specific restriction protein A
MKFSVLNFFKSKELRYAARSSRWPKIRKEFLANNPCCAACGKCGKIEVHHIEPVHCSPDKELDMDNLISLCDDPCHIVFGHLMNFKSWNPDVVKDCMVYNNKCKHKPYKQD